MPTKGNLDDDFVALGEATSGRDQELKVRQLSILSVLKRLFDICRLCNTRDSESWRVFRLPLVKQLVFASVDRHIEWAKRTTLTWILEPIKFKSKLWGQIQPISVSQISCRCIEETIFDLYLLASVADDAADHGVGEAT